MVPNSPETDGPLADEGGQSYDDFAWLYDQFWSREIPFQLFTAVERLLLPHLPPGGRVLDLCCGTGRIAAALVDRGFRVTGLDASEGMLRLARANAPGAELVRADARCFQLAPAFHGAVSLFDSLNHMPGPADLTRVLENVRAALVEDGRFVFDLNMERSFELHWKGDFFTSVGPEHASIMRGSYDPRTRQARCEVTLFRLRDGAWQRSDCLIREWCHAEEDVRQALARAGFREVELFDAERDLGLAGHEGRVVLAARK